MLTGSRPWRGVLIVAVAAVAVLVGVVVFVQRGGDDDPCGPKEHKKVDGTAWKCTFADDFIGTKLDPAKWLAQETSDSDYTLGGDCYLGDDPDNVRVDSGSLFLTARREETPLTCQGRAGTFPTPVSGGMVTTHGLFSQAYGRFEIRAKFPKTSGQGILSALWLFPQEQKYGPWPKSGEIDIAEFFSAYPDRAVPRLHYPTTAGESDLTSTECVIKNPERFHTYVAEWSPRGVVIKYDGRECFSSTWQPAAPLTGHQPFDRPFIVALTQGIGVPSTANAYIDGVTALPATMEVDYVRVWE